MAYDQELAARIRTILKNTKKVGEKQMFSGLCFLVDDKMLIAVNAERLMVRIDPKDHEKALRAGSQTVEMRGRAMKGYVYVRNDLVASDKELIYWVQLALEFNPKAKSSKTSKKKK